MDPRDVQPENTSEKSVNELPLNDVRFRLVKLMHLRNISLICTTFSVLKDVIFKLVKLLQSLNM